MEQRRVQAGSPSGGQFAPENRAEPSLSLERELPYMADGSFLYPPALSKADQVVQFWKRCPVEDHVLRAVDHYCRDRANRGITEHMGAWDSDNPNASDDERRTEYASAQRQFVFPHRGDVRDIVRLGQMMNTSRIMLVPDERTRLEQAQFTLPVTQHTGTAQQLLGRYGLAGQNIEDIAEQHLERERERGDSQAIAGLARQLEAINNQLVDVNYNQQQRYNSGY